MEQNRNRWLPLLLSLYVVSAHAQFGDIMGDRKTGNKIDAIGDVAKAASISEADVKKICAQVAAHSDKKASVAPAGSPYAARLAKLTAKHVKEDGLSLNFKVYLSPQINAMAYGDGSIRFYSGLMDKMTDDELSFVIGHEIGHVKHGDSTSAIRTAYLASAGRKAAASSSGVAGALADSQLGDIAEKLVNSQFSQSQETNADDYGINFLKKHKYNPKAANSALLKLADASKGGERSMFSTHPEPAKRAERAASKESGPAVASAPSAGKETAPAKSGISAPPQEPQ